ncbi:hypothetical protein LZC95_11050 [Pendulispora brunnea]|uniref:Uncharacterized protein n=1 Tax=Pendulispora brunnea TaxID=2905690 RepID=A0ABZ2KIF6_9BACT
MMSRLLPIALVAGFLAACGKSTPPPRSEEVPMGTESTKREARRPDPEQGEDVTAGAPAPAAASSTRSDEDAEPAFPTAPAASTPSKGSSKGASKAGSKGSVASASAPKGSAKGGGPLNKAECDQLMDRYIDVVVTGEGAPLKGMSGKELDDARNMIKSTVASDPNYKGMKEACLRDLTKGQYSCAMKARAMEEFQNCIR